MTDASPRSVEARTGAGSLLLSQDSRVSLAQLAQHGGRRPLQRRARKTKLLESSLSARRFLSTHAAVFTVSRAASLLLDCASLSAPRR